MKHNAPLFLIAMLGMPLHISAQAIGGFTVAPLHTENCIASAAVLPSFEVVADDAIYYFGNILSPQGLALLGEEVAPTAIETVESDTSKAEIIAIYDITGRQQTEFVKGVNIIVRNDGTKEKIYK